MTDLILFAAVLVFVASLAITEYMSPHKWTKQMISHSFQYSVLQVVGFVVVAAALIHTMQPVAMVTGAALIAVPITDLWRFGRYRKRIHVAAAGIAFAGVFVLGVMLSATPVQIALTAGYPLAVIVSWMIWRNSVVMEKVAAWACIAWMLAYSAGV